MDCILLLFNVALGTSGPGRVLGILGIAFQASPKFPRFNRVGWYMTFSHCPCHIMLGDKDQAGSGGRGRTENRMILPINCVPTPSHMLTSLLLKGTTQRQFILKYQETFYEIKPNVSTPSWLASSLGFCRGGRQVEGAFFSILFLLVSIASA